MGPRLHYKNGKSLIESKSCLFHQHEPLKFFPDAITIFALINDLVDPAHSVRMQSSTRSVVWILDVTIMLSVVFHGAFAAPKHIKTMIACLNYLQKVNFYSACSLW